jgi:hypothetical protein
VTQKVHDAMPIRCRADQTPLPACLFLHARQKPPLRRDCVYRPWRSIFRPISSTVSRN